LRQHRHAIGPKTDHLYQLSRLTDAHPAAANRFAFSRRGFLQTVGYGALGAALVGPAANAADAAETAFPRGAPLRVKPALTYQFWERREKTSWRSYGALQTKAEVNEEVQRIGDELKKLSAQAEFPIEVLPVARVASDRQAKKVADADCDVILIYGAGGFGMSAMLTLVGSKAPKVMFLRHKSGPHYLWYEIAHWRLLRNNGDTFELPDMDVDDIVVDDYDEMLWRLRALYGLKNARGTKMLAIGGLAAYSEPAQKLGPTHAREVWDYEIEIVSEKEFDRRLQKARADEEAVRAAERQTAELIAQPGITLQTERKFVLNSFLALGVVKELMKETGASNFGFAHCMGHKVISMLDTPPCLILSLANDSGYTAYCHTDLSHTLPGVLLRWTASRPTFVCNSHFPHHSTFTVAHCAAPRMMNGKDFEPTRIMTHFESDYGAATKVQYTKGQVVTVIIPNLHCTKWQGFRGKVLDSPSNPACRSQMDIEIEGNWRKLLANMQGFHTQVCYGDYLREVGYAVKKLRKIEWENFSESV
jgi:L-fucose isomerase-like protein